MTLLALNFHKASASMGSVLEADAVQSNFDSELLENVSLETSDTQGHKALCRYHSRVIVLSPKFDELSKHDQFAYIAFELYNLAKADRFEKVIQTADSVDILVRDIELLEHDSALQTQELMKRVFKNCVDYELKHVDRNFDSFYALEQLEGHSQWIAKKYRPNEEYRGTIADKLEGLSSEDRETLYALLYAHRHDPECFEELYQALTSMSHDSNWAKIYACAEKIFSSSRAI